MKALILSILFLSSSVFCFAQSCSNIKKAYAYYTATMPGAQMVDENGNPIPPKSNITRFIYIEYSGTNKPEIKTVLYNGAELSFTVINVTEKTVSIGEKVLKANTTIKAKKGNSFLKIELQPKEGNTMPDTDCKSIVIQAKTAGKLCKFYIGNEKHLATLPMY